MKTKTAHVWLDFEYQVDREGKEPIVMLRHWTWSFNYMDITTCTKSLAFRSSSEAISHAKSWCLRNGYVFALAGVEGRFCSFSELVEADY